MGFISISINSVAKYLVDYFHPYQLMFFYSVVGGALLLPFYLMEQRRTTPLSPRTRLIRLLHARYHILRAGMEFVAFSMSFYAIAQLPLPMQTSVSFSSPIFASLFAVWFLKEHFNRYKFLALILGMVGVVIISDPMQHRAVYLPPEAVAATLFAAILFGACGTIIKRVTTGETPLAIAMKMLLLVAAIATPFAISHWKPILPEYLPWILLMGILTASVQFIVALAMKLGSVTNLVPLTYVNLIWSSTFAYFFFDEIIAYRTMFGACIIIAAALIAARKPKEIEALAERILHPL